MPNTNADSVEVLLEKGDRAARAVLRRRTDGWVIDQIFPVGKLQPLPPDFNAYSTQQDAADAAMNHWQAALR